MVDGQWTVPHIGMDAAEAKDRFRAIRDAGTADAAFLFVRPQYERRWKRDAAQPAEAVAQPEVESKPAKKKA